MSNQTPPVVEASEDQFAKLTQVNRDLVRKGKIDGPTLQYIIGHPTFVTQLAGIYNGLADQYRQSIPLIERPPFALIQVGTHANNAELRKANLADPDNRISDWGGSILKKVEVAKELGEAKLIVASNAELGYPNGCTVKQTYEAGLNLGWMLCESEDAPQFQRQYGKTIKLNEWLLFAMEPITGSYGDLKVFRFARDDDGLWLRAFYGDPDGFYNGCYRWVFRCK